jgi:hypothetical protein
MFRDGTWVVRSTTNPNYSLDCSPERMSNARWCPRVVIYLEGSKKKRVAVHTAAPNIVAFETPGEAAEMGRLCGEQWIATREKN